MTDDSNIHRLPTRIGIVVPGTPESDADPRNPNVQPSESPDAPHMTGDNFSPADTDTLSTMGLDASVWPHCGDYARRVREARDRAKAIAVALDCLALQWVEIDRELTALLGEDTTPGGVA